MIDEPHKNASASSSDSVAADVAVYIKPANASHWNYLCDASWGFTSNFNQLTTSCKQANDEFLFVHNEVWVRVS